MSCIPDNEDSSSRVVSLRSSFASRFKVANTNVATKHLWSICAVISLTLVTLNSLAYVIVEYGIFGGDTEYSTGSPADKCFAGLQSSSFDVLDTDNYDKWFDTSSTMVVAETGTYNGAQDIREYVEFAISDFFDYVQQTIPIVTIPILMREEECEILFVTAHKTQINAEYASPACVERIIAFKLYFTLEPTFNIHRIHLFYPSKFLSDLFGNKLNSDGVRDYVCNTMESNCQDTFQLNNLTEATCRATYDDLPATNSEGYLDDKSKGCRILHSAFAAKNEDHCAHLSFVPQEDPQGRIKCQESQGLVPSDLFSEFELDVIEKTGVEKGFPADTLFQECDYNPTGAPASFGEVHELGVTKSVPTASLNDAQFQVYVGFIMWITMVLTGLGTELLVWRMFLQDDWGEQEENRWRVAQFAFPLLGATTVGLANSHNFLALPLLVVTMWKFGFPETILFFHSALYDTEKRKLERSINLLKGVGTVVHHSCSALYVAMVLTQVIPSNRYVIGVTLPLLMQHWFVLLRYSNKWAYMILETLVEVWFEWTAISSLQILHELHWTGGIILGTMLFAHWIYFIAGGLGLFVAGERDAELGADRDDLAQLKRMSLRYSAAAGSGGDVQQNIRLALVVARAELRRKLSSSDSDTTASAEGQQEEISENNTAQFKNEMEEQHQGDAFCSGV